jgi:ribonuclease HII
MEKPKVLRQKDIRSLRKNSFERTYWEQGLLVCGIDEAGRGPLAGPVVAAAVVLPIGTKYRLLKDSKVMTAQERELAYKWLMDHAWYGVGICRPVIIDSCNIYQATLRAMQRAICQLFTTVPVVPGAILVDAMPVTMRTELYHTIPVHAFIYGESLSTSVAAASIIAKVIRDRIMTHMDAVVPGYDFTQHKGYSTPDHCHKVRSCGATIIHRVHFVETIMLSTGVLDDRTDQSALW